MKEYILMLKNTFKFSGKSSRREFWMAVLVNSIISILLVVFVLPFIGSPEVFIKAFYAVAGLYEVLVFIPMLSLTVRRLHDVGRSGWYVLIGAIALIGEILLIYWLAQPSDFRVNVWYAGYKDNPDEIKLEESQKTSTDSVEKIIAELNELKLNNKISQKEYDEILSQLSKK